MTIGEIVKKYLEDNGYDGLCNYGECGCENSDLMPCDCVSNNCEASHKEKPTEDNYEDYDPEDNPDWVMVPGKAK